MEPVETIGTATLRHARLTWVATRGSNVIVAVRITILELGVPMVKKLIIAAVVAAGLGVAIKLVASR